MSDALIHHKRATRLRRALVGDLERRGAIVSPDVRRAFLAVPRHLFAPETPDLATAYADDVIRTRFNDDGAATSAVSAPWLQASMLELARITSGMRCLEIGSGGYQAALIAELVGPEGLVTTVDIDPYVTERAHTCLDAAGYGDVRVVLADGEHGVVDDAPYDRIIVAVGVWDVPPAWTEQLAEHGRLIVPLRLRGLRRVVCLIQEGAGLVSTDHLMAGFIDIRGAGARAEEHVSLHPAGVTLRLDDGVGIDTDALRRAVTEPRLSAWSGVRFGEAEPFDELFLWLATTIDEFGLLTHDGTENAKALVDVASPIGTPTHLGEQSLAYLTYRKVEPEPGSYEFGAHAHGPESAELAAALCEQIRVWGRDHRGGPPARITLLPATTNANLLPPGRIVPKRHTTVVISWT